MQKVHTFFSKTQDTEDVREQIKMRNKNKRKKLKRKWKVFFFIYHKTFFLAHRWRSSIVQLEPTRIPFLFLFCVGWKDFFRTFCWVIFFLQNSVSDQNWKLIFLKLLDYFLDLGQALHFEKKSQLLEFLFLNVFWKSILRLEVW